MEQHASVSGSGPHTIQLALFFNCSHSECSEVLCCLPRTDGEKEK